MNPRQRRGIILIGLAVVGAIAVFIALSNYVSDVRSQVGEPIRVLRLTKDVDAYKPLGDDVLESVSIPKRWAPDTALTDRSALVGEVAATTLKRGSILQSGMVLPRPALQPGERELAILVDAETGVAGKVRRGSVVNILATFAGDNDKKATSEIIIRAVRVLDVGDKRKKGGGGPTQDEDVVPVTFALSDQQTRVVSYAASFAEDVRLALLRPGDGNPPSRGNVAFRLDGGRGR